MISKFFDRYSLDMNMLNSIKNFNRLIVKVFFLYGVIYSKIILSIY